MHQLISEHGGTAGLNIWNRCRCRFCWILQLFNYHTGSIKLNGLLVMDLMI